MAIARLVRAMAFLASRPPFSTNVSVSYRTTSNVSRGFSFLCARAFAVIAYRRVARRIGFIPAWRGGSTPPTRAAVSPHYLRRRAGSLPRAQHAPRLVLSACPFPRGGLPLKKVCWIMPKACSNLPRCPSASCVFELVCIASTPTWRTSYYERTRTEKAAPYYFHR